MRKTLMQKPVYLGLSIVDLSKTVIYELWDDYVKRKYNGNTIICCMDTNSFIVYVKTEDICKDISKTFETRFNTSHFELDRPLPSEKNKRVIGII